MTRDQLNHYLEKYRHDVRIGIGETAITITTHSHDRLCQTLRSIGLEECKLGSIEGLGLLVRGPHRHNALLNDSIITMIGEWEPEPEGLQLLSGIFIPHEIRKQKLQRVMTYQGQVGSEAGEVQVKLTRQDIYNFVEGLLAVISIEEAREPKHLAWFEAH